MVDTHFNYIDLIHGQEVVQELKIYCLDSLLPGGTQEVHELMSLSQGFSLAKIDKCVALPLPVTPSATRGNRYYLNLPNPQNTQYFLPYTIILSILPVYLLRVASARQTLSLRYIV